MEQEEYEFNLLDRLSKIKDINEQYNLLDNSYIALSGGKDSTVLHYLIDLALPNNRIPRVFTNTGIEYKAITDFVKELAKKDDRIIIIKPTQNIKKILTEYGYPFKSKEHSQYVALYQKYGINNKTVQRYLNPSEKRKLYACRQDLRYQFTNEFKIKVSDNCCKKLKKEPANKWAKENNKSICITGMQQNEGGNRKNLNCIITDKDNNLRKFHPLAVISSDWEDEFVKRNGIKLCKLYYAPFNLKRTGCCGCPFNLNLSKDLQMMKELLPVEYRKCNVIWKPIYDEYKHINYRLKEQNQMDIFDIINKI